MYLEYGSKETEHLKSADKLLGKSIDKIGHIYREIDTDTFSSVVKHIIGQQISTSAQVTIIKRLYEKIGIINAKNIYNIESDSLQKIGISFRKTDYIKNFAQKVFLGEFDIEAIHNMPDENIIKELSSLKGIGVWTAEMIMIFCLKRPDVLSFTDLAIIRGMKMLYNLESIDKNIFLEYSKLYSPYGTVASLYLWAISANDDYTK